MYGIIPDPYDVFEDFSKSFNPWVYADKSDARRQNYMVIVRWSRVHLSLKRDLAG